MTYKRLALLQSDYRDKTTANAINYVSSVNGLDQVISDSRDSMNRSCDSGGEHPAVGAPSNTSGQPGRLIGGLQDGTDITELHKSRDLFAGVLDAATEQSIIATDPQGLITVFNTGAERMLGYSAQEMIGTSPERLHDAGEIQARAAELNMPPGFGVFLARAATGRPETRQ